MVHDQIKARGVDDVRVLSAMEKVPRHEFVPAGVRSAAYNDEPLSIGKGQTISQPYIVAYMTEQLELKDDFRVLEIGTGCGYQTAVLAELVREVYTVEIIESLSLQSQRLLSVLGYGNIYFKVGDGVFGWEEFAPFDAILVTAAPDVIPTSYKEQLAVGGRLIIPVGQTFQDLVLVERLKDGYKEKKLISVRFVPLV